MINKKQLTERSFTPSQLSGFDGAHSIQLPVDFIHDLSKADSLQAVLDTIAYWISHVFDADRASITLQDTEEYLKLYSISGNHAIPMDCKMLSEHGMGTCMDAPMIYNGVCIGTLNVADQRKHHYTLQQAILLQSLATWLALNIKLHLQVQEMAVLASTDELTGTFNRRVFVQESNQTMQHFSHTRVPFTIGILDIDHFKQLNDCYGHTAGDHVLKKMAKQIRSILRDEDFLARIGGEEFAIILPACLGDEAMQVFKRICSTIEAMEVHYEQEVLCFTVSIGVAEVGKHDADAEDVFKRADKALYCAKQAGRNRIHFAN